MTDLDRLLKHLGACREAREWATAYQTLDAAWAACERADWLLWLAGRLSGPPESASRKRLVLCACACARTALRYVLEGEDRPLRAIETAEAWARGEGVTLAEVRTAAAAAADAAAYAAYVSAAAAAAAYVAAAAASDDDPQFRAAYAARAADDAAHVASYAAHRATTLLDLADLVRQHYPMPPTDERATEAR